jgi:hypothetical protein
MEEPAARDTAAPPDVAGMLLMILAGVLVALLVGAGVFTLSPLAAQGTGRTAATVVLVAGLITLLTLAPGIALRRGTAPSTRSLGTGLCLGAAVAVAAVLLSGVGSGGNPSRQQRADAARAVRHLARTHHEAYYLGSRIGGQDLGAVTLFDGSVMFGYGACDDDVEGECDRRLTVLSRPTAIADSDGENFGRCRLLRPVLGVPAANLAGSLMVFTGSSMVEMTWMWPNSSRVGAPREALARKLRAVGQRAAPRSLPSPDAGTRAFLNRHCGS